MAESPVSKTAISDRGMVASASPRAAAAGIQILQSGGNAFDAALAVAAMEWLTMPEKMPFSAGITLPGFAAAREGSILQSFRISSDSLLSADFKSGCSLSLAGFSFKNK